MATWKDFLRSYGLRQEGDGASDFTFNMDGDQKRAFILQAVQEKELIPIGALELLGVGPLEDIISEDVLDSLDKLERESDDPEIRERICELIAGIYVHGDPIAIRRRWIALVRRVATLEVIASLQGYFDQLLADESDPT